MLARDFYNSLKKRNLVSSGSQNLTLDLRSTNWKMLIRTLIQIVMKKSVELTVIFAKHVYTSVRIEVVATNETLLSEEEHPGVSRNIKFIYLLDQ